MTEPDPSDVARRVVDHFRRVQRDLPWRKTTDAYSIWVSEIMLQQTRVATVIPYYERWLERFPTVTALADAELDDVLGAWAGLGYYSRARNLHRGAREVVATYEGVVPDTAGELRSIPGIGRYTAGAIASMAFGRREPLVDGNVARVLARVYEVDGDIKSSATTRQLWQLAAGLVPADAPGDFNQGLMELGATICTPSSPTCMECPLFDVCGARASGRQGELPVVRKRKKAAELPLLDVTAVWVERRGKLMLARRRAEGLYGGLWELPELVDDEPLANKLTIESTRPVAEHRQTLSHRRLRIRVIVGTLTGRLGKPPAGRYDKLAWQPLATVAERGISAGTAAIIEKYRETDGWNPTEKR